MWHWEEIDPARSGSSGDLAKLFKNEGVKEPGPFAAIPLPADAILMAREVIQNSWDAARELHESLRQDGQAVPEFRVVFRFEDLDGEDKRDLVDALHLRDLRDRVEAFEAETGANARSQLGLSARSSLDDLDDDVPLRILKISEQATTGMYGPFSGAKSKLYLALVSIGITAKEAGAGGTYGYGKAGLIRGSGTRTVLAYTCFAPRHDEPEVTRRLLGMTYWGLHELEGSSYSGFARFGSQHDSGAVLPFVNDDADRVAGQIGFDIRTSDRVEELGSTFLLVDPTVDPHDLCTAIERSWWPAIEDQQFTVEIVTGDGARLFPRPRKNPVLQSFIRSWEVATMPQDNVVPTETRKTLQKFEGRALGRLGLVADPAGWSYPQGPVSTDDDTEGAPVEHRSLVALVRGPRMVVEYFNAGQAPPFVRGTFVADPEVDDLLRQTEPKAHDSWQTAASVDGIDPIAPKVARAVLSRIRSNVNAFRNAIKPPAPRPQDIRLPVLDNLFKHLLDGRGTGTGRREQDTRLVRIRVVDQRPEPDADDPERIRFRASVGYSLSDHYTAADSAEAKVSIRFYFVEDQTSGERCPMTIEAPSGFTAVAGEEGAFRGDLGREEVLFTTLSDAYSPDWTGRLVATGTVTTDSSPSSEESAGEAA